jgi:two-component system, cell cycle response regulator DivK
MHARMVEEDTVAARVILIVEDDERSRKLLRDVLQFYGYATLEATTGEEAIELARSALPQLILMDLGLPGLDGEDAFLQLRGDPSTAEIPVVAVTASVMRGGEQRLRRIGFDGYIPKPIDVVGLPGIIGPFFTN